MKEKMIGEDDEHRAEDEQHHLPVANHAAYEAPSVMEIL